tara:strand:- start:2140 stop:2763 length:624 start_codon:yes stop_codon:yes gene_type:complete
MKIYAYSTKKILPLLLAMGCALTACQSTQKTSGEGLISVVAQNVLKLAGEQAIKRVNFSAVSDKPVKVELKGFVEEKTQGFIENLVSSNAETNGALLIRNGEPEIIIETVVNSAGNDQGSSSIPILNRALRTESVVDLTIIFRDANSGKRISTQNIRGESKYEQKRWVGLIDESGKYYVKISLLNQDGIGNKIRSDISNDGWLLVSP